MRKRTKAWTGGEERSGSVEGTLNIGVSDRRKVGCKRFQLIL